MKWCFCTAVKVCFVCFLFLFMLLILFCTFFFFFFFKSYKSYMFGPFYFWVTFRGLSGTICLTWNSMVFDPCVKDEKVYWRNNSFLHLDSRQLLMSWTDWINACLHLVECHISFESGSWLFSYKTVWWQWDYAMRFYFKRPALQVHSLFIEGCTIVGRNVIAFEQVAFSDA